MAKVPNSKKLPKASIPMLMDSFETALNEDEVSEILESTFSMMVDLAADISTEEMNGRRVYQDIAGRVFDFAVNRFLPEPPEGECELGSWAVPKEYRDAFIERINDSVSYIPIEEFDAAREATPKWIEPTPETILREVMEENGWKKFGLLKAWLNSTGKLDHKTMGLVYEKNPELSAEHQFLTRHVYRVRFKSVVTDHHESLARFIRAHSKKYANVKPIELTWRPAK